MSSPYERLAEALASSYRLERPLGEGGMATVHLAQDLKHRRRVAVKVVRPELATDIGGERFLREIEIAAGLNHPHILAVHDSGNAAGVLYYVTPYVEGESLRARLRRERPLPLDEALRITREVADALGYAHQRGVIHRDIKPENILLQAGHAIVADFGIARVVGAAREARGTTPRQPLTAPNEAVGTPDYMSPEQVLGEAELDGRSDQYAVACMLYEMLAGRRPFQARTESPLEVARLVCETTPERPSMAASAERRRALAGDLDNIALKAMRKEPERRYVSVEQFAGDVRRYLEGRPVLARKDTLVYRTTKFVRRNIAASVAAGLLLMAIVGGTAATAWQARVATQERGRAERRFNEVRELARNTLFELDGAIQKLPGSTAVRSLLCDRTVKLLDGLAKDASGDFGLQLELAEAYRRLSRVQGNVLVANLGDRKGAEASGRKSLALADAALTARPKDIKARVAVSMSLFQLAASMGDGSERSGLIDRMIAIDQEMEKENPGNEEALGSLVAAYQMRGTTKALKDPEGALRDHQHSLEIAQRLVDTGHTKRADWSGLSFAHKKVGAVLIKLDRLEEAAQHYGAAMALDERLVAMDPKNPGPRYDLTFTISDTAFIYGRRHEYKRAIEMYQRVLEIREALSREDPQNVRTRHGVVSTNRYLAWNYRGAGDWKTAVRYREHAIEALDALLRIAPGDAEEQVLRGWLYLDLGEDYAAGKRREEEAAQYKRAAEIAGELKAKRVMGVEELEKAARRAVEGKGGGSS